MTHILEIMMNETLPAGDRTPLGKNCVFIHPAVLDPSFSGPEQHQLPLIMRAVPDPPSHEYEPGLHHSPIHIVLRMYTHDVRKLLHEFSGQTLISVQAKCPFCCDLRVIDRPVELAGIIFERMLIDIRAHPPCDFYCPVRASAVHDHHSLRKSPDRPQTAGEIDLLVQGQDNKGDVLHHNSVLSIEVLKSVIR